MKILEEEAIIKHSSTHALKRMFQLRQNLNVFHSYIPNSENISDLSINLYLYESTLSMSKEVVELELKKFIKQLKANQIEDEYEVLDSLFAKKNSSIFDNPGNRLQLLGIE